MRVEISRELRALGLDEQIRRPSPGLRQRQSQLGLGDGDVEDGAAGTEEIAISVFGIGCAHEARRKQGQQRAEQRGRAPGGAPARVKARVPQHRRWLPP